MKKWYVAPFFVVLAGCALQPRGVDRIDHVVVIYEENWSFDGLYGLFPGANGLANAKDAPKQADKDGVVYAVLPPAIGPDDKPDPRIPQNLPNAPFDLMPYVKPGEKTGDMDHSFYSHQQEINGGRNDRFVAWSGAGALPMSHYDASDFPQGKLAREFTLADNFFQGAFGGSFLNHQWLVCACTPVWKDAPQRLRAVFGPDGKVIRERSVTPDGYVVNTEWSVYGPHPTNIKIDRTRLLPPQTARTIGDALSDKGVSWAWYAGGWNDAIAGHPHEDFQFHHQPFVYYASFAEGSEARREHLRDETQFLEDLRGGRLPAVSFIKPLGPLNQHPGYADVSSGQEHVAAIVEAIRASAYWKSVAVIITYDEYGGRWDHVPPPRGDRWGPGTRIPAIVVSPYAKKGFVDHTQYDTTSILRFIERRFALAPLGERDAAANDLTNAFE